MSKKWLDLRGALQSPPSRLTVRLEELEAAAEAALDAGNPQRAADLLREALVLAPLDRHLRERLADALMAMAEQNPRKRASGSNRIVETLHEEEIEDEGPRRPSAPAAALAAASAAADSARSLLGNLMERDREEASRPSATRPRPGAQPERPASKPARKPVRAPRAEEPTAARAYPKLRRPRGRFLAAAALYAGISLVLLGAAQGMISYVLRPADLPEVPVVVEMPEELSGALQQATDALAAADPRRAIGILEAVEEDHPAHHELVRGALARAWRAAGNQELDRRDYSKAVEAFGTATRLDPLNADNWIELGRSYREHGRSIQSRDSRGAERLLVRAQDAYERALDVSKDDPAALVGLAQTLTFLGNRNEAVARYERVLELAPDSREATLARQHLRQLTGRS